MIAQQKGFTIVEVLIAVGVLAVIAVSIGQLNISLSNTYQKNTEELNLKNEINKLNIYLDKDIRSTIAITEVDDATVRLQKPQVGLVADEEAKESTLPSGRDYSSQIEYKLELQEGDLVLKRNNKVVLSQLNQDIITSDGPQIDRILSRNNKRIDINLSLENKYRDTNLGYEIKDRVYLQDTDDQGAIIYYKSSYGDETYIHYQLDGGDWETDPPGIKMISSQYAGYKKIYIPLENNTLEMAFNDGHDDWDNNSGNDYSFSF